LAAIEAPGKGYVFQGQGQLSRTSSLLQASTSFCGSELVREEGGAVDAFLRLEYSLREQVRSYRHPRAFVGANLFAKRAVQSMHFLRLE
ncbi:hypothetical protein RYB02_25010, partial [Pseudomonas syringae pv. actinidiae]|nr:hypothetical protein [Pseudomonas syringae pv. actinidiae]MDU8642814.1 hypothetical protein [Pseudomonas syringae pv. actinidiae]